MWRIWREEGVALIVALVTMTLMLALGSALMLVTTTETQIAANHRDGVATLHAADAAIDLAISSLRFVPRWSDVLSGASASIFVDGPPFGVRRLVGGRTIDLAVEAPREPGKVPWRLYVHGTLGDLVHAGDPGLSGYVAVWVVGDPAVPDALTLWASAFGPGQTRRNIEATVARVAPEDPAEPPRIRRLTWRER
jgi:hypothetical protein